MAEFQIPDITPRLDHVRVQDMFAHVLRLPEVFTLAHSCVTPELFDPNAESHFLALWCSAVKVLEEYGMAGLFESPAKARTLVEAELAVYFALNQGAVSDDYRAQLLDPYGAMHFIYEQILPEHLSVDYARRLLRLFVEDRLVQGPLRRAISLSGVDVILNLPLLLQQTRDRHAAVAALDENPVELACPDDWTPTPLGKFTTGVAFLDKFMNGGHAPGETYGVLGAFGSGKTTLAVQIVVGGASHQQSLALEAAAEGVSYKPKKWYFFHYEGSRDEMRVRLMSCLCEIDKDLLEEWRVADMSTAATLKLYEQIRWAEMIQAGDPPAGEKERWEHRRGLINHCFGMIDMSGTPKNPRRGQGYVPEIGTILDRDLRESSARLGYQVEVGGVVIDYAGLAVRRHVSSLPRASEDAYYHLLSSIGEDCRRLIAVPFHCPVWLMHQLSGQANKRASASRQGHADAAGSASFAENLHFCFALGTKDDEHGSVLLTCSKARRAQVGASPRLEFDVPVAALRVSDLVDNGNGQLVRRGKVTATM